MSRPSEDQLNVDDVRRIDRIADQFERDCQASKPTCALVAAALADFTGIARQRLCIELIGISLDSLQGAERSAQFEEFLSSFSEYHDSIVSLHSSGDRPLETCDSDVGSSSLEADSTAAIPGHIGRYEIDHRISAGGAGEVFLARDNSLDRDVAIKVPHRKGLSEAAREAFLCEARVLAALEHPHILPVYDFGVADDARYYVVSKFVDGSDLRALIGSAELTHLAAAEIVATVANALHAAHSQELIHRDVKPANILLDATGKVVLADFGLALTRETFGQSGAYAGTPAYMSPEQVRGEGHLVDGRSDIFSLGVTFYELLTGQRPFIGSTVEEVVQRIADTPARPPRQLDDSIPSELERICLRALANRTSDRYTTSLDFARDIERFLASETRQRASHELSTKPRVKVIPKGLRAFGREDADFYTALLPGVRDADGRPELLRGWLHRLDNSESPFRVGLIYGPSGCGKSSFVQAGLLQSLDENTEVVRIEATPHETEAQLKQALQRCIAPPSNEQTTLASIFQTIRQTHATSGTGAQPKKILIVVDQFEQWLQHHPNPSGESLTLALRQCDGVRLQCLLMVRDEFWRSTSRFFHELGAPLVEGENSTMIDLFDREHARNVLERFGRAYGQLPPDDEPLSDSQQAFLVGAVSQLAEQEFIAPVRLALFAEMMKSVPWTEDSLVASGGILGIGVRYLQTTFEGANASAKHREHADAARKFLQLLLPETEASVDLKGASQSTAELQEAVGYTQSPQDFKTLVDILDHELRLISPTETDPAPSNDQDKVTTDSQHYQLSHDYLVPAIRTWLDYRKRQTQRGRAEIKLKELSQLWQHQREPRFLPSTWELLKIRLLTDRRRWSVDDRALISSATKRRTFQVAIVALTAALAWGGLAARRQQSNRQAEQLAAAILTSPPDDANVTDSIADDVRIRQKLEQALVSGDTAARVRASFALSSFDNRQFDFLFEQLLTGVSHDDFLRFCRLERVRTEVPQRVPQLLAMMQADDAPTGASLRAACLLATMNPSTAADSMADFSRPIEHLLGDATSSERRRVLANVLLPFTAQITSATLPRFKANRDDVAVAELLGEFAKSDPKLMLELVENASTAQLGVLPEVDAADARLQLRERLTASFSVTPLASPAATINLLSYLASTSPQDVGFLMQRSDDIFSGRFGEDTRTALVHRLQLSPHDVVGHVDRKGRASSLDAPTGSAWAQWLGLHEGSIAAADRERIQAWLADLFQNHPDAGCHGAAGWALRKIDAAGTVKKIVTSLSIGRPKQGFAWYISERGETYSLLGPASFGMGTARNSPYALPREVQSECRIDRCFAIATTEVTVAQFQEFCKSWKGRPFPYNEVFAPDRDCPQTETFWFVAAAFCNWLSAEEKIPKDQWCYEPLEGDRYRTGMSVPADFLERSGYRLPTEAEWEFACRGGTSGTWHFGETPSWLSNYAWCDINANGRCHAVGTLLPNQYGLFDMLGNLTEWCHDQQASDRRSDDSSPGPLTIVKQTNRMLRGGAFSEQPRYVRSAIRFVDPPDDPHVTYGFRVVRTVTAIDGF